MYGYVAKQNNCTLLAKNMNKSQNKTKTKIATKVIKSVKIKRRFINI